VPAPTGFTGSMAWGTAKGSDYVLDVYDVASAQLESSTEVAKSLQLESLLAAISPQGRFVSYVAANRRLYVTEIGTGERGDVTHALAEAQGIGRVSSLDWVNDDLLLASVGNTVITYHANSSMAFSLFHFDQDILSLPLFPAGWKFVEIPTPTVTGKKLLLKVPPQQPTGLCRCG
jgi:hypothetical protein